MLCYVMLNKQPISKWLKKKLKKSRLDQESNPVVCDDQTQHCFGYIIIPDGGNDMNVSI